MKHSFVARFILGLSLCICLLSCSVVTPSPSKVEVVTLEDGAQASLTKTYLQLTSAGGQVTAIDPAASTFRIFVFRAGQAAKLGHNHVLSAPRFSGFLYVPASGLSNARFDLDFRLDELEIDVAEHRANLGPAFTSVLSSAAIDGTREHMLGQENMQADQFPMVRIHSLAVSGELPKLAAKVQISMHGVNRELWVPLDVDGVADHIQVKGAVVLRQSDFGIHPYSVLGGLIAVQDEVVIEFVLKGRPA